MDSLRYDALTRSPINSLFAATLASLPTIRAFEQGPWLRREFEEQLMEDNGRAVFTYFCFTRWLGVYTNMASLLLVLACLLASYLARPSAASSSSAALALTSVF